MTEGSKTRLTILVALALTGLLLSAPTTAHAETPRECTIGFMDYLLPLSTYDTWGQIANNSTKVRNGYDMALQDCFGQIIGAGAMLKNLACVFGHRRCACMENALDQDRPAWDRFLDGFFRILNESRLNSTPMSGIGMQAMDEACP